MPSGTESLAALIRRDIETGSKLYAEKYGYDWFNITPAEAEVFELALDDLPSLVAVWCAYEAVLGICDILDVPDELAAAVRAEQPFMAEIYKIDGERSATTNQTFENFAKLFNVPFRKSHAWYSKMEFYHMRMRLITFNDETGVRREGWPEPVEGDDDEVPF